jgi:membrane protease YdiL (CAAX protease family)
MQGPLEKRYGPVVGIAITSFVFLVLHLNQAWAPSLLLHLFALSVLLGILAYASNSIIPGIVAHVVMDVFFFSYWFSDVAGRFDMPTIAETGIDLHFSASVLVLVTSTVLFLWAARKTLAVCQQETN